MENQSLSAELKCIGLYGIIYSDYVPINYSDYRLSTPPLFDYIDNIMSIIYHFPTKVGPPPQKFLVPLFLSRLDYGKRRRYKVESISA